MSLRHRALRYNSALLTAAKLQVEKSKAGRFTKPSSTPELRDAIKKQNALCRTITGNRVEYLEGRAEARKL